MANFENKKEAGTDGLRQKSVWLTKTEEERTNKVKGNLSYKDIFMLGISCLEENKETYKWFNKEFWKEKDENGGK